MPSAPATSTFAPLSSSERTACRSPYRDLITVVSHAAAISAGEWITATGEWVNDRTHGQQFKARFLRISAPTSSEGIEKYLCPA
jgi:hypothetical protein